MAGPTSGRAVTLLLLVEDDARLPMRSGWPSWLWRTTLTLPTTELARAVHGVRAVPLEQLRSTGRGPGACGTGHAAHGTGARRRPSQPDCRPLRGAIPGHLLSIVYTHTRPRARSVWRI